MNCDFKKSNDHFECRNCGFSKKKKTIRNCPASNALGERVAAITKAVGIKPCGSCQKRREALNRATIRVKEFFKKKGSRGGAK